MSSRWITRTPFVFNYAFARRHDALLQRGERAQVQVNKSAEKHQQSRRIERRERNAKKQRAVKHGNNKRMKELK
jgi:hypothetical protein